MNIQQSLPLTKTIANINGTDIQIVDDSEKFVPIKPICELLGVTYSRQLKKVKEHELFGSVVAQRAITARDGKQYKMNCLPMRYVFGWMFTINPSNVKEDAQPALIEYQKKCCDVLYDYFSSHAKFVEEKDRETQIQLEEISKYKADFSAAKNKLKDAENKLKEIRQKDFEEWKAENSQLALDFKKKKRVQITQMCVIWLRKKNQ